MCQETTSSKTPPGSLAESSAKRVRQRPRRKTSLREAKCWTAGSSKHRYRYVFIRDKLTEISCQCRWLRLIVNSSIQGWFFLALTLVQPLHWCDGCSQGAERERWAPSHRLTLTLNSICGALDNTGRRWHKHFLFSKTGTIKSHLASGNFSFWSDAVNIHQISPTQMQKQSALPDDSSFQNRYITFTFLTNTFLPLFPSSHK